MTFQVRPSAFIGRRVMVKTGGGMSLSLQPGTVLDVLYAITGYEGCIDERLTVVVELDSGRFVNSPINRLTAIAAGEPSFEPLMAEASAEATS